MFATAAFLSAFCAAVARLASVKRRRRCGYRCAGSVTALRRPRHGIPAATWQRHIPKGPFKILTADQVRSYYEDGYLVLHEFIDASLLDDAKRDVTGLIDTISRKLVQSGKVSSDYASFDWTQRLKYLSDECPSTPLMLIKAGIISKSFQEMYQNPRLLDVLEDLGLGPDIAAHPAWNLRAKMPSHPDTVVPWHQDNSYWEPRLWDEHIITGWISLVDATVENGCLQFFRKGHESGRTAHHTIGSSTSTWYTELTLLVMPLSYLLHQKLFEMSAEDEAFQKQRITMPVKKGSVILFGGTTPHRSLPNLSTGIRWSCDFRWHAPNAKRPGKTDRQLDYFYGLKDSLLVRVSDSPSFKPCWTDWASVERTAVQDNAKGRHQHPESTEPDFDDVIVGPWMDLWNIDSPTDGEKNIHTQAYMKSPPEARSIASYLDSKSLMW